MQHWGDDLLPGLPPQKHALALVIKWRAGGEKQRRQAVEYMRGSVLWQAENSNTWSDISRLALLWKLGLKTDIMTKVPSCFGVLPIDLFF